MRTSNFGRASLFRFRGRGGPRMRVRIRVCQVHNFPNFEGFVLICGTDCPNFNLRAIRPVISSCGLRRIF